MAKKLSPDELRKLKEKATEAAAKGKFDKAAEHFREVVEGDPRDVAAHQKLAEVLRRAGRIPEAIQVYREVADRFAKDGLLIKAIAISKTILELDPQHLETQTALAELYAQRAQAEGARPPPRTLVVQAMKGVAAPPPPPRETGEGMVAIPLGPAPGAAARAAPPPPPAAEPLEISIDMEAPVEELAPEVVIEPEPEAEPILEILPEPPPPPRSPAPPPRAHAQAAFEAPAPPPRPRAAAPAPPPTAFARIVSAAHAAVEAGIEEDLLIQADPVDGPIIDDEPLAGSGEGAAPPAEASPTPRGRAGDRGRACPAGGAPCGARRAPRAAATPRGAPGTSSASARPRTCGPAGPPRTAGAGPRHAPHPHLL